MPRGEDEHPAAGNARHRGNQGHDGQRSRRRFRADFTYISGWVKYTMFFFNFLFWVLGALLMAIGIYAVFDKFQSGEGFRLDNVYDVLINLAFLLVVIGGIVFIVSFAGCIGALRENVCLLKFYSLCLLLFFLAEMALAGLGLIFPHKLNTFIEGTLSQQLISSYRDDLDFQNLMDLAQQEFGCCGISSDGFRDWNRNAYFNCTEREEDNRSVERCGVPFSCCIPKNKVLNNETDLVNTMCGYGLQNLDSSKVKRRIYTRGCIPTIQSFVEKHLFTVGGAALGVATTQLLVIWLSRTLEGQIEDQRSLWQYN